ncbi:MAG: Re/Si-specific NAD(P)(+) transhydrogenase subunit alpha, partial [Saezia sp.]
MGAQFVELKFQEEAVSSDGYAKEQSAEKQKAILALLTPEAKNADIIVTTALIPGKPAPTLITKEMVASMKAGSVIVDLAAQNGGNCELTVADQLIETSNGVKIIGYTDLASRLATQSSQLYGTNLLNLMKLLCKEKDGNINLDFEDVIIHGATVVKDGEKVTPPAIQVSQQPKAQPKAATEPVKQEKKPLSPKVRYAIMAIGILLFATIAHVSPKEFLSHFTVFSLACVVGYYVVWNVTHALHTPLMSVTNAISGIIVVGAVMQIGQPGSGWLVGLLSFVAILIACINIFGGFFVTQRMLKMFIRK